MTFEMFAALVALTSTAAFTPGPNNALVASSGATFGYRRTLPHILGIAVGFAVMIFIVGFFLGGVFQASSLLREGLRWGGAIILLWLAWKIATAGGLGNGESRRRPFKFVEAAAFQWINPKAWTMAIAITTQFIIAGAVFESAMIVAAVSIVAGLGSASAWALTGRALTRWINTPRRLKMFNLIMAALIAACVVLLFIT
ncbi:MAG: threonine/homoserine/homoserine lactone efflux protein [Paracoccaceae bacterium]|jgi:threonine/homoserine/homoserine lactone efflux protein